MYAPYSETTLVHPGIYLDIAVDYIQNGVPKSILFSKYWPLFLKFFFSTISQSIQDRLGK